MIPDIAEISWSDCIVVKGCDPFHRNSWTARVEFEGGYAVAVVLPVGARHYSPKTDWEQRVTAAAVDAYKAGDHECFMR